MEDLDKSLDSIREAKKFSLNYKIEALQQLILQRFQTLTTISSISFVVAGIIISVRNDLIQNQSLAFFSLALFIAVAFTSFGRYLYLIRSDIKVISQKIKELPDEDWNKPLERKEFKADWWPEIMYILLIIGVLLFGLSLIEFVCNLG